MSRPFVVEHIKRRGPAPVAKPVPKSVPLSTAEVLDRVTRLTNRVLTIQGVSRNRPDAFAIDKDEAVQIGRTLLRDIRERGIAP